MAKRKTENTKEMSREELTKYLGAHRKANFACEVAEMDAMRDPQPGEFALRVTYNGFQFTGLSFTPAEWRAVAKAVRGFLAGRRSDAQRSALGDPRPSFKASARVKNRRY